MPSIRVVSTAQSCKSFGKKMGLGLEDWPSKSWKPAKNLMKQNPMWCGTSIPINPMQSICIITCESPGMLPCASVAKQTCAYTHLPCFDQTLGPWDLLLTPQCSYWILLKQGLSKRLQHLGLNSMMAKASTFPWKSRSIHSHSPYVTPLLRTQNPTHGSSRGDLEEEATNSRRHELRWFLFGNLLLFRLRLCLRNSGTHHLIFRLV